MKIFCKFLLIALISTNFIGCMAATAYRKGVTRIDYDEIKAELQKRIPNAQITRMADHEVVEMEAWRNIRGAENTRTIFVDRGDKVRIIKERETRIYNSRWEGVVYNRGDTLFCSVISPMADAQGHADHVLDILTKNEYIRYPKSHVIQNGVGILSTAGAAIYATHNNPLLSDRLSFNFLMLGLIGDIGGILALLSYSGIIETNENPDERSFGTIGKIGLGAWGLSKGFVLFSNQYISEYNAYYRQSARYMPAVSR